ncbi:MAG: hypothetical protein V1676_04080 [Candidatus Diapherotrites archaeon]
MFRGDGFTTNQLDKEGKLHEASPFVYRPFAFIQGLAHKLRKGPGTGKSSAARGK